ncbi:hypothetical protein OEZ71_13470 [Defluviimonas sp. WL0050]|uniref:Uncharacterized protein n=1 Tax=Albidovulum litorale TaxID=2984134 RepID=A0ABT2ZQL7_9RHOB|nr:hypothetical protein [Defluviimonas sp. WL0050]MCV2873303.1 hypothetical protein [Defluviimonas sp. WL0050]
MSRTQTLAARLAALSKIFERATGDADPAVAEMARTGLATVQSGSLGDLVRDLGLSSVGGVAPSVAAALAHRDAILRSLARRPVLLHLAPFRAATLIRGDVDEFRRRHFARHDTAPAAEPAASLWRLIRGDNQGRWSIPGTRQIADLIAGDDARIAAQAASAPQLFDATPDDGAGNVDPIEQEAT